MIAIRFVPTQMEAMSAVATLDIKSLATTEHVWVRDILSTLAYLAFCCIGILKVVGMADSVCPLFIQKTSYP